MTFRLEDGSAFLRVHKPKMYGDKLNKKRKIIIDTNQLRKNHFGFEVGKLKMTYRVVLPIFYLKKYIGLVEVGIEPEYVLDKLNKIYNLKNALLIKKDMKSVSLSKKEFKPVGDDFYLARGDEIFYRHHDKIIFNIKHNHIIENNREYHIDSQLNLLDHKTNVAAKILLAYDTTENIKEFNNILQLNIFRIIILVCIILIILNIGFNYFINKIVSESRKNIKNEKQLSEQSKMVSMGEMIGNIAHQWRQPLSVISTAATGMKIQKEFGILEDIQFIEYCDNINTNAQYLSKTIDDFQDFIKGDRTKDIFNLTDNINTFLILVKGSIKNNHINIILDLEENININGYKNELSQCLINIFNNAKDILVENEINNKLIFISTTIKEKKVIIKIKDNAGGIPENVLPKVFEPYFTTKHKTQGTGLGLNMTYNLIVDGMNGSIVAANDSYEYNNKSYTGALFTIVLPVDI